MRLLRFARNRIGNLNLVSLRGVERRGNLIGKNVFLFMRLLHSVRNDIIKVLPNY